MKGPFSKNTMRCLPALHSACNECELAVCEYVHSAESVIVAMPLLLSVCHRRGLQETCQHQDPAPFQHSYNTYLPLKTVIYPYAVYTQLWVTEYDVSSLLVMELLMQRLDIRRLPNGIKSVRLGSSPFSLLWT